MNKKKAKGKKSGCGRTSLWILLLIILVVLVTVFVVFSTFDDENAQDERFAELINREYNKNQFKNEITQTDLTNFNNEIKRAVSNTQAIFDENNNLIGSEFFSENVDFTNTLYLDNKQIAIFYNYVIQTILSAEYSDDYAISIYQLDFTMQGNLIEYSAKFHIIVSEISSIAPVFIGSDMPDEIFVTVNAQINIINNSVLNVSVQINNLTGEDNEYCINKILNSLSLNSDIFEDLANSPFEFLRNQRQIWQVMIRFEDNQIIIN